MIEHAADTVIETLDHRCVGGVLMLHFRPQFILKMLDEVRRRFNWCMRRVVSKQKEEGPIAGRIDKPNRSIRQFVGQVVALSAERQTGDIAKVLPKTSTASKRPKKGLRRA